MAPHCPSGAPVSPRVGPRGKIAQPDGNGIFAHLAGRQLFHHPDTDAGIRPEGNTVQSQEGKGCHESPAVVAIDKGMRLGDAIGMGRRNRNAYERQAELEPCRVILNRKLQMYDEIEKDKI